ncbi:MAG: helix-turn-helix transcriptional regulator [Acidimicrobiia bacterium]
MPTKDSWQGRLEQMGSFIRAQRRLADLSLRDLAAKANVSNPYLSQIERGLHEPSVRVIRAIAQALNLSAETLLSQAGLLEIDGADPATNGSGPPETETAIRADTALTDAQKQALLTVYRSYVAENA